MDAREYWYNVSAPNEDHCMIWMRSKTPYGYGKVFYNGKLWGAHRLAWTLTQGPIPKGLYVLHRCDNPPCCNPEHLFLGTNAENLKDMREKKRHATEDTHGRRKLSSKDVLSIHLDRKDGMKVMDIAKKYNICYVSASFIVNGKLWKGVYNSLPYDPVTAYKLSTKNNLLNRRRQNHESKSKRDG